MFVFIVWVKTMLDIQVLRNDMPRVTQAMQSRNFTFDAVQFSQLDEQRKTLQTTAQELQAKRNQVSKQIGITKSKGEDASAIMAEVGNLGEELKQAEDAYKAVQEQ